MKLSYLYSRDEIDALAETIGEYLEASGAKRVPGGELLFSCPAPGHEDRHPSARWNPAKQTWCCYSRQCHEALGGGATALAGLLGIEAEGALDPERAAELAERRRVREEMAEREEASKQAKADAERRRLVRAGYCRDAADALAGSPWAAELERRGISREVAGLALIGLDPAPRCGIRGEALSIPWLDLGADVSLDSVQYRNLDPDAEHGDRYRWLYTIGQPRVQVWHGDAIELGRIVLGEGTGPLVLVEGALKAAALWSAGWSRACAVYNAGAIDDALVARLRSAPGDVYVIPDPDARERWRFSARAAGARLVALPGDWKPDDFVIEYGPGALAEVISAARAA